MFTLKELNAADVRSIEYHFENEDLNIEFIEPLEIEITDTIHTVVDSEGIIFIIKPDWIYISIEKRVIRT